MQKMRMCFPREKTFEDGFKEYILDCKARNLRDGTIHHYHTTQILSISLICLTINYDQYRQFPSVFLHSEQKALAETHIATQQKECYNF